MARGSLGLEGSYLHEPHFVKHFIKGLEGHRFDETKVKDNRSVSILFCDQNGWGSHYPSTPAENARLLSSNDDIPVSANIRA